MAANSKRDLEGERNESEVKKQKISDEEDEEDCADISELDNLEGFPKVVGGTCNEKLAGVVEEYLKRMQENGESITQQLSGRRDFSNPDMLPNILKKYGINQHGTMLKPTVWAMPGPGNPNNLTKADFFSEISAQQNNKKAQQQQQQQHPVPSTASTTTTTTSITRKSGIAGRVPGQN